MRYPLWRLRLYRMRGHRLHLAGLYAPSCVLGVSCGTDGFSVMFSCGPDVPHFISYNDPG